MKRMTLCILIGGLLSLHIIAKDIDDDHLYKGNLALPTSQEPSPCFSFGQNIVDKGDFQLFSFNTIQRGNKLKYTDIFPDILYGITDNCSLYAGISLIPTNENGGCRSSGLGDSLIQIEYAFYNKDTFTYSNQATVVISVIPPTGSGKKNPATGYGSPAFFFGFTACHMGIDWYPFASIGATVTTSRCGIKFGDQFLFQGGIAKNLAYSSKRWILTGMLEFLGTYTKRDRICNVIDCNSGGASLFIGPSLWFATQQLIVQVGVAVPLVQHLFGQQNETHYLIVGEVGWKFNSPGD